MDVDDPPSEAAEDVEEVVQPQEPLAEPAAAEEPPGTAGEAVVEVAVEAADAPVEAAEPEPEELPAAEASLEGRAPRGRRPRRRSLNSLLLRTWGCWMRLRSPSSRPIGMQRFRM